MNRASVRLLLPMVVAALCIGMLGGAVYAQCYEDVVVSGAGVGGANDTFVFSFMNNGKPFYAIDNGQGDSYLFWDGSNWKLGATWLAAYINTADTPTPPSTGWELDSQGTDPAPTLTGGEECIVGPSITVSAISGNTGEDGTTATFAVVLSSQPTANVMLPLSSDNTGEGMASPTSLVFSDSDWDTPKTVTVTGVDDDIDDGDIAYTIITGDPTSSDPDYDALGAGDVTDVSVTNQDNDTLAIIVTPTSGLVTTESGGLDTFTVVLNCEPSSSVSFSLWSNDPSEGNPVPSTLVFTAADWDTPQTVTIQPQDDDIDDGDIDYTIITGSANGEDYDEIDVADVSVTNEDDDAIGITVTPTSGLVTTEAGGVATFTVVLDCEPSSSVSFVLWSDDPSEGNPVPSTLVFTTADWDTPQTVTVEPQDDDDIDGDVAYTIITGSANGEDYDEIDVADVSVTNEDDDIPGITVTAISSPTTEAGGTATFEISADTVPSADVIVPLSSSNTGEGTVPASVTLPSGSTAAVTVTVTGVDDDIDDGDIGYTIITGDPVSQGDAGYEALGADDVADVSCANLDNDTRGITVSPTAGLVTTEAGGTDTFTVVLDTEPTATVTIGLSSTDTSEGTVLPASLSFTPENWDTPQTATVTGVDDDIDDGDIAYSIVTAAAAGGDYAGLDASDVSVSNTDDDTRGATVNPTSGLVTTEAGGQDTFTVVLDCEPTDTVTIVISSSDATEGAAAPATLTFTIGNWDTPQTVTVTGVDDSVNDGGIQYTILTAAAAGGDYAGIDPDDVSVTNANDDTPGITVSAISGNTAEDGTTATFTAVLTCEPTAPVEFTLDVSDATEGELDVFTLTFTAANWDTPQTVTVTGLDDTLVDGDIEFTVITSTVVSTDGDYSGLEPADVVVVNEDDDTSPLVIIPTGEAGPEALLDVMLPVIEGEEPLMAGSLPLAAIHAVGDVISGGCMILGTAGTPMCNTYVHMYLYSVDIDTRPETVVLLTHWMAEYNWARTSLDSPSTRRS